MQIYSQWNSLESGLQFEKCMRMDWGDYGDFIKYLEDPKEAAGFRMMLRFFEGIGVLVHRELIDVSFVDDLMSGATVRFWEKFNPVIEENRVRTNWPQAVEWFEYLYNQVKPLMMEQHPELKDAELKYRLTNNNR
jgi:hypothetical protein